MLVPKKMKYRKSHRLRGQSSGKATKGATVNFGTYGLKALHGAEISARQIEASRRAMTRYIKRGGKIWIRIFPHKPITQKAAEVPMGSGKGSLEKHVAAVKAGTILFEMDGVTEDLAKEAMRLAAQKLPVKCKFINADIIV
ncbi:50S ribosomal protein L16 [Patescibacteria group bacterium]|nr:50S ribosomal protein L16 [Patescibacteria group bacterium]MBU1703512.1 50S ribosomal protein L16 [Patescibacteria group bacterium]MBU1953419.1 50S ribosomal protein L16 [Patescibacteria group bacterium]